MKWYVYILHCENDSYYVGHTNSVENRFARHAAKSGAQHTTVHTPETVEYIEEFSTEQEAVRRERQIKKWTRAKKQVLIEGKLEKLRRLSKSRS